MEKERHREVKKWKKKDRENGRNGKRKMEGGRSLSINKFAIILSIPVC
jgi:hypothetical protein